MIKHNCSLCALPSLSSTHTHSRPFIVLFILVAVQSISYLRYVYVTYFMRVSLFISFVAAAILVTAPFYLCERAKTKNSHCNDQYETVCYCSLPHFLSLFFLTLSNSQVQLDLYTLFNCIIMYTRAHTFTESPNPIQSEMRILFIKVESIYFSWILQCVCVCLFYGYLPSLFLFIR